MDRTQAFVEYARILDDSRDWLTGGFRRGRNGDAQINIPGPSLREGAAPADSHVFNQDEVSAPGGGAPPSAGDSHTAPADASPMPGNSNPYQQPAAAIAAGHAPTAGITPPASETGEAVSQGVPTKAHEPMPDPGPPQVAIPLSDSPLGILAVEISTCHNCNLYLLREQTVPGIGSDGATLMVVTPPPADSAGELSSPLPAYESEYLGKWLGALGLNGINDVFITPAVKCRTPGGRPPQPEEASSCAGYLRKQYKAVAPKAVLALGGAACGALTGNPADFPSLVGKDWTWGAVPALVLWTPAEVLANPGRLREPVWDALKRLKVAWNAVPGNKL